ncbi:LysR family transcriptional regulator [Oribacterium sp. NK2B42]|uniref:LysR family transcriptional regulator n=1 Tax=Oribacterium sp. NK2B42 TaxID=689781 RepID=UPI000406EBC3|nr:LysR family transcriptional regulator [Oribacterium sp. NK2B42]MBO5599383.1 LysR family transcriptional regulator [Oribacterium sp.]MBO6308986.1 LysR family transcriptional regulator [Oribacterium sp.]MBP3806767.1 LysR family transcriptional regulator [Oribacterium sp.]
MDLKPLENIIAIYNEESIAKAAEKMYMTQSALNQQLLKLEAELGTPLFERRYHKLIPTFAGRIYVNAAKNVLQIKNETYKIIRDSARNSVGEISIACTPERGAATFSDLYPQFHQEYPDFSIKFQCARVPRMEQMLLHRETEYAFLSYSKERPLNPSFEHIDLAPEDVILGLPSSHPLAHLAGKESWKTLPLIDLNLLKDENFIMPSYETMLRGMLDKVFSEYNIHPKILFESSSSVTILKMAINQMGPAFFPQSYVNENFPLAYFRIKEDLNWMRCVAYLKGTYITTPERRLFELWKQVISSPSIIMV